MFTEAGINQATGYRRLKAPGDISLDELRAICSRFGVPIYVMAEGDLATLRWFRQPQPDGPPDGQGVSSTIWKAEAA